MVSLNGKTLVTAPKVPQANVPTWSQVYTDPIEVGDYDQIEIRATDIDIAFHDPIGVCTSQGMPYVDKAGYASSRTFTCLGQLWAVALRVSPVMKAQ